MAKALLRDVLLHGISVGGKLSLPRCFYFRKKRKKKKCETRIEGQSLKDVQNQKGNE